MDVVLGWERLGQLKLIKQADVVMLLALLGERYPGAVQEVNFRYYEPLTVHDSSLSPSMHALVAARLGDLDTAERYLEQATGLDLAFEHGTTPAGGVHIATLGGIWQALVLGFGGMTVAGGEPCFTPHVPASWGVAPFPGPLARRPPRSHSHQRDRGGDGPLIGATVSAQLSCQRGAMGEHHSTSRPPPVDSRRRPTNRTFRNRMAVAARRPRRGGNCGIAGQ
jgi:hypothetical protein